MQPDVEMLSASPVLQSQVSETPALETPVLETPVSQVSETPVSETQAENLTGLESSSTSSQGSEELTADQLLSGGRKRRIRRY